MAVGTEKHGMADPRLRAIECWIFDLDNTLYPASSRFFEQVSRRMTSFISNHFKIDPDEARNRQKSLYFKYGTTLRGLMVEEGISPEAFLEYVHDVDLDALVPNAALASAIAALPGTKLVHTNGSLRHAQRILSRLGLEDQFAGIFDIAAADFVPKPDPAGYRRLCEIHAVEPNRACMIEDIVTNLKPAADAGMVTVLIAEDSEDIVQPYVDYRVSDLTTWLQEIVQ